MAKILPGTPISDARGAQGTIVYTNNRWGLISRVRVTPANPKSPQQTAYRNALKTAMSNWQTALTEQQRLTWRTFGDQLGETNAFGNTVYKTGLQLFLRATVPAIFLGETPTTDPPRLINLDRLAGLSIATSVAATNLAITWTAQATPATNHAMISLSAIQGPGTSAPRGTWSQLWHPLTSAGTSGNIWATYTAARGVPSAGEKGFLKAHAYDSATGAYSAELRLGWTWQP
jgi:hypothetical protein